MFDTCLVVRLLYAINVTEMSTGSQHLHVGRVLEASTSQA